MQVYMKMKDRNNELEFNRGQDIQGHGWQANKKQPSSTRMGEGEAVNGGHTGTNSCRSLYLKVTHQYFSGAKNESVFSYSSRSIRCVNASANKLEHLPPSSLSEESHSILQELYLTNNRLTDKCVPMLTGHTHLRILHMAYNHLQTFPARWTTCICSSLDALTCISQFTCWLFQQVILVLMFERKQYISGYVHDCGFFYPLIFLS